MGKITVRGYITVPPFQLEAVKEALIVHTELTREEEGCLSFDAVQRTDNPTIFDIYEEFVDDAAFSVHQARAKGSRWGEISGDVRREFEITRS